MGPGEQRVCCAGGRAHQLPPPPAPLPTPRFIPVYPATAISLVLPSLWFPCSVASPDSQGGTRRWTNGVGRALETTEPSVVLTGPGIPASRSCLATQGGMHLFFNWVDLCRGPLRSGNIARVSKEHGISMRASLCVCETEFLPFFVISRPRTDAFLKSDISNLISNGGVLFSGKP